MKHNFRKEDGLIMQHLHSQTANEKKIEIRSQITRNFMLLAFAYIKEGHLLNCPVMICSNGLKGRMGFWAVVSWERKDFVYIDSMKWHISFQLVFVHLLRFTAPVLARLEHQALDQ